VLKRAIDDDFQSVVIASTVTELPSRRSHILRPQAQAISRALFPQYTPEKVVIHYENSRRKACQSVRANREAEKAHGFRAHELRGPWAGQETDPVSLTGPEALLMLVHIEKERQFKDYFHFLTSNQDPNDIYHGVANKRNRINEFNLQLGTELVWNTLLVEFERGVVYIDGRLDLCKMVVGPTYITALMEPLRSNSLSSTSSLATM
jgi:NLR family CARD domain-containing protein 3